MKEYVKTIKKPSELIKQSSTKLILDPIIPKEIPKETPEEKMIRKLLSEHNRDMKSVEMMKLSLK